ncbi:hypothetical protein AVEN_137141-1 [Araneus ventricosus]|uniref:Uncharacterized protein n=1 Tax=Araneus ventricosus TaxID=182803 RepID=A0A4Y2KN29_ARAVE|nr:hypothetical protein AVEN_137141-1 [Araneus ventricosus]
MSVIHCYSLSAEAGVLMAIGRHGPTPSVGDTYYPRQRPQPLFPFKAGSFGRIRHELDSPNQGGHLPHPTTCCNLPLRRTEIGCGGQGSLDSLPRLSSKRSQNITSTQKKPTASDRPSSFLRENF